MRSFVSHHDQGELLCLLIRLVAEPLRGAADTGEKPGARGPAPAARKTALGRPGRRVSREGHTGALAESCRWRSVEIAVRAFVLTSKPFRNF